MTDEQVKQIEELKQVTQNLMLTVETQTANEMMWRIAAKTDNGEEEGRIRARLHMLLDQNLDYQVRSLQLVKILSK